MTRRRIFRKYSPLRKSGIMAGSNLLDNKQVEAVYCRQGPVWLKTPACGFGAGRQNHFPSKDRAPAQSWFSPAESEDPTEVSSIACLNLKFKKAGLTQIGVVPI
jgi:hypothetical protein